MKHVNRRQQELLYGIEQHTVYFVGRRFGLRFGSFSLALAEIPRLAVCTFRVLDCI